MKTAYLVAMASMLAGGCTSTGDDTSSTSSGRIPRELRLDLHHPTPVFPEDFPALDSIHGLDIDPNTGQVSGDLWVISSFRVRHDFRLVVYRDMAAAGPMTRYLTEAHFDGAEARLTMEGVEYSGAIDTLELDIDLLHGIAYGTLDIRFVPTADGVDPVRVGVDLAGYIDSACYTEDEDGDRAGMTMYVTPDDDRIPYRPEDPAACIALFEALRATPDDPNSPPPPYSLDDTPDDGPAWIPSAPPPE